MNNNFNYIYHHLGLGDHIICNGLVRFLKKQYNTLYVFCKPHNFGSVKFMYRDDSGIVVLPIGDDLQVRKYIVENDIQKFVRIIGFGDSPHISWDEYFYLQQNVNFNERWKSFKVDRDKNSEKKLYHFLNKDNEKFVLIHSKGSDNIDRIDYTKINNNYKKIFVDKYTDNIFDYSLLIEMAEEVHCVESSFHLLVDHLNLNQNIFFHTLNNNRNFTHKIKSNWNIV